MTTETRPDARETLDEVIDRVAAAMTVVPMDAGFAARLEGRLRARRASWLEPRGMVVAALAVAVVVFAVSLTVRRSDPRVSPGPEVARGLSVPVAPPNASAPGVDETASATGPQSSPSPTRPRRRYISHDPVVPQIAALSLPAALGVDAVDPVQLTIQPVELAPLDLANLPLSDPDSSDPPKE